MNNFKPVKSVKIETHNLSLFEYLTNKFNEFIFIHLIILTIWVVFNIFSFVRLLGMMFGFFIYQVIRFKFTKPKKEIMVI